MSIIQIQQVFDLSSFDISSLVSNSIADGHKHIQRLLDEYRDGENQFKKSGESLFIALINNTIVGICGLNQYVYNNSVYGRIRRLYVHKDYRKSGIGRLLVEAVIRQANGTFEKLILRTDNPAASLFYKSLGFQLTTDIFNATHVKEVKASQPRNVNEVQKGATNIHSPT